MAPTTQPQAAHQAQTTNLLSQRAALTEDLSNHSYDPILYLRRATIHAQLLYPDLASGDAYRALLLTDEAQNSSFEYHNQALSALSHYTLSPLPLVLAQGGLTPSEDEAEDDEDGEACTESLELARLAAVRSFQILAYNLALSGSLKSAWTFCRRGLMAAPTCGELLGTKGFIIAVGRKRASLARSDQGKCDNGEDGGGEEEEEDDRTILSNLPDSGLARRELYPWNSYEPDRFSASSLAYLNAELKKMAPDLEVRVSELPILGESLPGQTVDTTTASSSDSAAPPKTCKQLGLFALRDIPPGTAILQEHTLLAASNRHKSSLCDACSTSIPPSSLGPDSPVVSCPHCLDSIFCDSACLKLAQESYHPILCVETRRAIKAAKFKTKTKSEDDGEEDDGEGGGGAVYSDEDDDDRYEDDESDGDDMDLGLDAVAKDPPNPSDAVSSLYLLLLIRALCIALNPNNPDQNPLTIPQVRFIWGDFLPASTNLTVPSPITLSSPSANTTTITTTTPATTPATILTPKLLHTHTLTRGLPPPQWTLPFTFPSSISTPLHILTKLHINTHTHLPTTDVWITNTLTSKFRGTASARKSPNPLDGRPEVAAVHPFWCLANHDCDPNVRWEWGGKMVLWARTDEERVERQVQVTSTDGVVKTEKRRKEGGLKKGEEILNHYCDIDLPVQERREWACGSLGGWCMCERCREEAATEEAAAEGR